MQHCTVDATIGSSRRRAHECDARDAIVGDNGATAVALSVEAGAVVAGRHDDDDDVDDDDVNDVDDGD
jgi:hypothetical protein